MYRMPKVVPGWGSRFGPNVPIRRKFTHCKLTPRPNLARRELSWSEYPHSPTVKVEYPHSPTVKVENPDSPTVKVEYHPP